MRTRVVLCLAPLALAIALAALSSGGSASVCPAEQGDKAVHQYVGVDKCKLCHMKKTTGEAYVVWKKQKHAKAFETLATPQAKEIAKKQGIEDAQKSDKCLRCHVTGAGAKPEEIASTLKPTEGVGCEVCHGPGGDYYKEEVHAKSRDAGLKAGMVIPDEKLCVKCHNKDSPSYKEFDYAKFSKEIAHPNPEKQKK